jgi:hypothetical protein
MKTLFTVLSLLSFLLLPHAQAQVSTITLAAAKPLLPIPTIFCTLSLATQLAAVTSLAP